MTDPKRPTEESHNSAAGGWGDLANGPLPQRDPKPPERSRVWVRMWDRRVEREPFTGGEPVVPEAALDEALDLLELHPGVGNSVSLLAWHERRAAFLAKHGRGDGS